MSNITLLLVFFSLLNFSAVFCSSGDSISSAFLFKLFSYYEGNRLNELIQLIDSDGLHNTLRHDVDDLVSGIKLQILQFILKQNHSNSGSPEIQACHTIFLHALQKQSKVMIKAMLEAASNDLLSNNDRYMKTAIRIGSFDTISLLMEYGFSPNFRYPKKHNMAPLHLAVAAGKAGLVRTLLKFPDIDYTAVDELGCTALKYSKSYEISSLLISACPALLHIPDRRGIISTSAMIYLKQNDMLKLEYPELNDRLDVLISYMTPVSDYSTEITIDINRDRVLEDAFYILKDISYWHDITTDITVQFDDEEAADVGGLEREFLSLLAERLFLPRVLECNSEFGDQTYGYQLIPQDDQLDDSESSDENSLNETFSDCSEYHFSVPLKSVVIYFGSPFECVDTDNKYYKISNSFSGPIEVYKFIGSFLGHLILNKTPLKAKFVPSIAKLLLGHPLMFADLEFDDPVMFRSMSLFSESDFAALPESSEFSDKQSYLLAQALEFMYYCNEEKLELLVQGFHSVLDPELLNTFFTPQEFDHLLAGEDKVDRQYLKLVTTFSDAFWENHSDWFWEAVEKMSDDTLLQLTRFITGINGLPYGGIRSVCHKRQIEVKDGNFPVPSSATCFYTLTLPTDVTSSDDLLDRIKISLSGSLQFEDS